MILLTLSVLSYVVVLSYIHAPFSYGAIGYAVLNYSNILTSDLPTGVSGDYFWEDKYL
jgi:hypothetical protein